MKTALILLIISFTAGYSQTLTYITEFGNFNHASSFDIDLNSNFYIADQSENTIIKLDSLGNDLLNIGGYGWEESTFDYPVSIFTNTLSVYIADKNNSRIQRLDKDLNYLSEYSGDNDNSEIEFAYPTCVEISNIGDLFLLDSDNNSILKFNLTGEFLYEIGGNDAGTLAINNPRNFSIDDQGNLYVLDDEQIKVFDQYGNGQLQFKPIMDADKIKIIKNNLWLINNNSIVEFNLSERKINSKYSNFSIPNDEIIVDMDINSNKLFVLTPKRIVKYKLP